MKLIVLLSFSLLCLLSGSIFGHEHGVVRVFVQEDRDAILPCSPSTKKSLLGTLFDWVKDGRRDVFMYESGIIQIGTEEFKGRVKHFTDELKNGNASIIIRNTKIEDSGNYTCVFPRHEPEERFYIELVVESVLKDRYGKEKGASPKPYITTLNVTEDGALLQCEVQGASPKPEVEFQDSAGNILPAEKPQVSQSGQQYTVTLITTVTKSDRFRCVAKQKEIHHETSAETYVSVCEKQFEDTRSKVNITGWFGAFFLGGLIVIAVQALLVATNCIKIQFTKGPCQQTKSSSNNHLTDSPESHTALALSA